MSRSSPAKCCSDFNCFFGEVCDNVTQKCVPPEVNITEEKAKELIGDYFSKRGKTVKAVTFKGARIQEGKGLRIALVDLEESDWQVGVTVTDDLEVMEYDVL